jgi:hypothetical protein
MNRKGIINHIRQALQQASEQDLEIIFTPPEEHLRLTRQGSGLDVYFDWQDPEVLSELRFIEVRDYSFRRRMEAPGARSGIWKPAITDPGLFLDRNQTLYAVATISGQGVLGKSPTGKIEDIDGELFLAYEQVGHGLERLTAAQLSHVWSEVEFIGRKTKS